MSSFLESIKSVKNPFTSEEAEDEPDESDTGGILTELGEDLQTHLGLCISSPLALANFQAQILAKTVGQNGHFVLEGLGTLVAVISGLVVWWSIKMTVKVVNVKKSIPKLSYKQRLIGFGISIGLAALFAIIGCALAQVNLAVFAVLFTLGTIAGVISTLFLVGPIDQAKKMCDTSNIQGMIIKISCAITLFVMIVLVFCAAFWWKIAIVAALFCVVEFVALLIYAITLIPYATTLISRGARSAFNRL